MLNWLLLLIALVAAIFLFPKDQPVSVAPSLLPSPTSSLLKIVSPVAGFRSRITKKYFGTYVTPKNSPVSLEKFTGYHTGIDVEYGDVTTDVPVLAIAPGEVITSRFASGYGGVIVIKHLINGQTYYGIYGHLRPSSLLAVGSSVQPSQTIGVLGTAYSQDTDGERRHLHFGLAKTNTILGYVQKSSQLDGWVDPLTIIPQ